jgi:sulfite exporter TauE/SafE
MLDGLQIDGVSWSLLLAAAAIGLLHTALGPDHYLPFLMLARARGWSRWRAAWITAACGAGHVLSSLALGAVGVSVGLTVSRLRDIEEGRGSLAAWLLVGFGVAYGAWGVRKAVRRVRGLEPHAHGPRVHLHGHGDRPHEHPERDGSSTFWALFLVFVLGPCEPLIPLVVVPASGGRWLLAGMVALAFGATTVVTMVGLTLLPLVGLKHLDLGPLERWSHAAAGAVIACSGLAALWFSL